ncbi:hypothetical protein [Haploplasma axanthum]|uniref:Uncharacterized protein n=1 Tax=Haploplasma axanthum TaxID=29552 RepID=A0A449BEY5_HAPAX|nr:hypothetical protein [Haploplasma axanthum]VEU80996.1 Uncharacterised protein [Haploplasma axanthum]
MYRHISDNKNEYNVRRVDELNEVLLEKERELNDTKGFFNVLKLKLEIKKIYKEISKYGSEVMEYENNKFNKSFN